MAVVSRLDADLTFSISGPVRAGVPAEYATGTISAAGLDVEVFTTHPEVVVALRSMNLRGLRVVAARLATEGMTVSFSGPNGEIGCIGAVRTPFLHRILTGSRHIRLGHRRALRALLSRRKSLESVPPIIFPAPGTLLPLVPTFSRRIRRQLTTTHYGHGSGRPRLIFVVGSENWDGQRPREFTLTPTTTTIGSASTADLCLAGLKGIHAEIRHDTNDEYVLHLVADKSADDAAPVLVDLTHGAGRVLRTGARIELGPWRMAFFREEYADHGRPFGGRVGGELAYQRPQEDPRRYPSSEGDDV